MSLAQQALAELSSAHEFFNRSTRHLTEAHSTFAPAEGMMTAAQQVAHVAHTIDWFLEGAFRPEGFDQNWEEHAKVVAGYTSLEQARAWFERAVAAAKTKVESMSDADLLVPLPEGPIMGGAPRIAVFSALTDHTAHHRGALTVYARLNGVVPPMPYMDM
ncbi:MAG: DinB family protein, partial [Acidobacteria bacterium]|nr:DinB family protein [Acidobacteriota bacterium]